MQLEGDDRAVLTGWCWSCVCYPSIITHQVGTPAFMAPEMANGSEGMSESVDVYSFGILLWCLATSQNPYFNMDVTPVQLLSR